VNDLTDAGFAELTAKISRDRGFGCASYKDKCLRRRIAVRMRARGVHTYSDYARVLDSDIAEYDKLLDALTINVTKLFRNWETYNAITEKVVPALWERDIPTINVWSAGCSSGEEPYSLAALFHQYAERVGALGQLATRVRVLGSDIDARCLAAAQTGAFEDGDFTDTPPELRKRYFAPAAPFAVIPEVKRLVRFERRDLLAEPAPPGTHHLICCRNVLIYFDRELRRRVFALFADGLERGGVLCLGGSESVPEALRGEYEPLSEASCIFRRRSVA
jgi:chemotaxis methyl-accepting protein methylase